MSPPRRFSPGLIRSLEVLLAVAETGQSAPTLSRKMAGLERATGQRLFLRGNRGYALTTEGRALLEEAEGLVAIRRAGDESGPVGGGPAAVGFLHDLWDYRAAFLAMTGVALLGGVVYLMAGAAPPVGGAETVIDLRDKKRRANAIDPKVFDVIPV